MRKTPARMGLFFRRRGLASIVILASSVTAVLFLILSRVSNLSRPADRLSVPEAENDLTVLVKLKGNVTQVSAAAQELRSEFTQFTQERVWLASDLGAEKQLRVLPVLRVPAEDLRTLVRSMGAPARNATPGPALEQIAPIQAPEAAAKASLGAASDAELATCVRRECARKTQCRYSELEQRWRQTQAATRRFDQAAGRFAEVPWELDPAKIWYLFPEVHTCAAPRRAGPLYDGGKNLCLPRALAAPCVVYSIGTWDDTTFEASPLLAACHIHAFEIDAAPRQRIQPVFDAHERWTLHPYGIAARDDPARGVRSLAGVARELGHSAVDVLKVDIEGGEFELLQALPDAGLAVGQLLVEVHSPRLPDMLRMTRRLDELGLVPFAREANTLATLVTDATGGHSCCFEYSFVHVPFLALCAQRLADARASGALAQELAVCQDMSGSLDNAREEC